MDNMPSNSTSRQRNSILIPLTLEERVLLTRLALRFFSTRLYNENCEVIGKVASDREIQPLSGADFLNYLKALNVFPEPWRRIFPVGDLLSQLCNCQILKRMSWEGALPMDGHYYFLRQLTEREKEGNLWLAKVLGADFLLQSYSKVTVHLTGVTPDGDQHAGTGIVVASRWVLTCAHVVTDMRLDREQNVNGIRTNVVRECAHAKMDVALIQFDADLPHLPGLAFRDPIVCESVYTLGYPRIPLSREPALIMQQGEVTNPRVSVFSGDMVFLYSAISRPGNSGGPVISATGNVVGIVTQELFEEGSRPTHPFHAGIGASELALAVSELEPTLALPMENYE